MGVLGCLGFLSVPVIKHSDKNHLGEERVCFSFQVTVPHKGKSGQELKAETMNSAAC